MSILSVRKRGSKYWGPCDVQQGSNRPFAQHLLTGYQRCPVKEDQLDDINEVLAPH